MEMQITVTTEAIVRTIEEVDPTTMEIILHSLTKNEVANHYLSEHYEVRESRNQINSLEYNIEMLEQKNTNIFDHLKTAERSITSLEKERDELDAELKEARSELATSNEDRDNVTEHAKGLSALITTKDEEILSLTARINNLTFTLTEAT
jgi:chromosome segregation ATPase